MKSIIVVGLIALTSAGQLPSRDYLPANRGIATNQGIGSGYAGGYSAAGPGGAIGNGNTRAQQAEERNAATLKLDQEIAEEGYRYTYETSNGIRAEEGGNTEESQGGFAYTGDDGNTYSVTYTAGVDGFQPQGAHLPVPPPTPQEILMALVKNARDESDGIYDDGQYHPDAEEAGQGQRGSGRAESSQGFGPANRQGSFNERSGYSY